jgi:hypothetical protein
MERIEITVQEAGADRGVRIYIGAKEIKKIKENYGENFFLFQGKKMVASINPTNETITISHIVPSNGTVNSTSFVDDEVRFLQNLEDVYTAPPVEEVPSEVKLDFYMPMGGVGEEYYIAEVCVNNKLAFYCVANSPTTLDMELARIGNKHFPGLLESPQVQVKRFAEKLVYSPVPSMVAKGAYENIAPKKINNVEIPASYSVPNDAELTPIVDIGENSLEGMRVRKRGLLAKYEIMALASQAAKVTDIKLVEIEDQLIWEVLTENRELHYDLLKGNDITESLVDHSIEKPVRAPKLQ